MRKVKSCGFLLFRREPELSFLLMRHPARWDLPKGHVDTGEDELQCAYRELQEETGIKEGDLQRDEKFRFTLQYPVSDRQDPQETVHKTLVIFLGWLGNAIPIQVTEHESCKWFCWEPPHAIQTQTVDPLLSFVEEFFREQGVSG